MNQLKLVFDKVVSWLRKQTAVRVILLGYIVIILTGTLLLCLPFASRAAGSVAFSDAFFTAASATCVTGLIRFDTFTTWTLFGQIVILVMIQIGGVGFMTLALSLLTARGRNANLRARMLMQDSISAFQLGGIEQITRFIIKMTAIVEGIGAVLLAFYYIPLAGAARGIWYSVFHSVSAFCNAGFDLMGSVQPYSSTTSVVGNVYVNVVLMLLIVVGGLGFFVWKDLLKTRFSFKNLRLHSKIVIVTSLTLIAVGAVSIFVLEQGKPGFAGTGVKEQILGSLFQSVSARTAGFNSMDISTFTTASQLILIVLMLIGGSPGSTAGGMKTTTFAIMFLNVRSISRNRKNVEVYHRTIPDRAVRTAYCVMTLYVVLVIIASVVISHLDGVPILTSFFESVSAIATVGTTLGITGQICLASKLIITVLMIFGRVGSLTMLMAFAWGKKGIPGRFPEEDVAIG